MEESKVTPTMEMGESISVSPLLQCRYFSLVLDTQMDLGVTHLATALTSVLCLYKGWRSAFGQKF